MSECAFDPVSPDNTAHKKFFNIAVTAPIVLALASFDNEEIAHSFDVEGCIILIVNEAASDCQATALVAASWASYAHVVYRAAGGEEPWPDIGILNVQEPEVQDVVEYILDAFKFIQYVGEQGVASMIHGFWHRLSQERREMFLLLLLWTAASSINTTVREIGLSEVKTLIEGLAALRQVHSPEDII